MAGPQPLESIAAQVRCPAGGAAMTALGEFVVEQPHRRRIAGPEPSGARVTRGASAYGDALRSWSGAGTGLHVLT